MAGKMGGAGSGGNISPTGDQPRANSSSIGRNTSPNLQYKVSGYQGSVRQQMPRNRGRSLTRSY